MEGAEGLVVAASTWSFQNLDWNAWAWSGVTEGVLRHRARNSGRGRRRSWGPDSVGARMAASMAGVPDWGEDG